MVYWVTLGTEEFERWIQCSVYNMAGSGALSEEKNVNRCKLMPTLICLEANLFQSM